MVTKYTPIMTQRNYERFRGNNRICCCGYLISARQIGIMVFVAIMLVIVSALYFAFDSRFFILNLHPIGVGAIFPIIAALGLFYTMSFLLKTACTDPGIIPRGWHDEQEYHLSLADGFPNSQPGTGSGRYMTVTVKNKQLKLKWCATCEMWRPPRASHCGLCNNCYLNFDHHCPWVGNCVAKRNYRYFYLFLVSVFSMCLYAMGCNVAVIVLASQQMGFGNALKNYPASVIEFIICGLGAIAVSGLACMHTWLIATGQTTNEDIKGTFNPRKQGQDVKNPYAHNNCCLNFIAIICGPFHPSLINLRGKVDQARLDAESAAEEGYGSTTPHSRHIPQFGDPPISKQIQLSDDQSNKTSSDDTSQPLLKTDGNGGVSKSGQVSAAVDMHQQDSDQSIGEEEKRQLISSKAND